jgi:hypothetical protein
MTAALIRFSSMIKMESVVSGSGINALNRGAAAPLAHYLIAQQTPGPWAIGPDGSCPPSGEALPRC